MAGLPRTFENKTSNYIDHRLRGRPSVVSFEQLNFGNSSVRELAPYALKIRQTALIPTQQFFKYAAVVSSLGDTDLVCIIFDIIEAGQVIAYAGHFIVKKDFVFDPITREPVVSVSLLSVDQNHEHLSLFGAANSNLLPFPDYFLDGSDKEYQELLIKTQEIFMTVFQVQQQNQIVSMPQPSNQVIYLLREPLTTSIYIETALPITKKSLDRITPKIQAMGTIKCSYGELGSFESNIFSSVQCTFKVIEDANDSFNAVDDVDGRTTYYSAYEEPGLMPFYFTTFLLGRLRGRYVVGVIVSDAFFIMATSRVYSRYSTPPASPIDSNSLVGTDVMERIHLPSYLPLEQVLTMLELRQILRHPFMYQDEMDVIIKCFGLNGGNENSSYQVPAPVSRIFIRQLGPKTQMERLQYNWLQQMLDIHYTKTFQNSLCEYGESPVDSENPSLFCHNIIRLWIKELLRAIHKDQRPKDDCKLSNFFRMNIEEFVQGYLSLFGLSPESCFTCHILGQDGLPMSICQTSIATKDIGRHMETQHTASLWNHGHFKPFSLVLASKFVSLTNQADVTPLEKCKSTVADFRGTSYIELLRKIDGVNSLSSSAVAPPLRSPAASQPRAKKRKRLSLEELIVRKVMQERLNENDSTISSPPDVTLVSSPTRITRSAVRSSS